MPLRSIVRGLLVSLLLSACTEQPHVPPPPDDDPLPPTDPPIEIPPGAPTDFTSVAASGYLSCARRGDGRLVCWGTHADGASATLRLRWNDLTPHNRASVSGHTGSGARIAAVLPAP